MSANDNDFDYWACDRDDLYDGPNKIYPIDHGPGCPGHNQIRYGFWPVERGTDPDNRPLPRVDRGWGYNEEVIEVGTDENGERYL